jgi:hypothetical protein
MDFVPAPFLAMRTQSPGELSWFFSSQVANSFWDLNSRIGAGADPLTAFFFFTFRVGDRRVTVNAVPRGDPRQPSLFDSRPRASASLRAIPR